MPGPFHTDMSAARVAAASEEDLEAIALRRVGRPEEIVGAAHYLLSESASFTTGSVITVHGGQR